jgi:hypothetical protein
VVFLVAVATAKMPCNPEGVEVPATRLVPSQAHNPRDVFRHKHTTHATCSVTSTTHATCYVTSTHNPRDVFRNNKHTLRIYPRTQEVACTTFVNYDEAGTPAPLCIEALQQPHHTQQLFNLTV